MSATVSGSGRTATLTQRRRDVLEDRGVTLSVRSSLGAPNATVFWILITVLSLITFGLVMVLSSSSIVALNRGMSPWRMFFKQLMWSSVGVLGMVFLYFFPHSLLRKFVLPGLILAFGLMTLPFAPGIGVSTNGARAWVAIGPVGFQPSEFLKLALLVYCAHLLSKRRKEISDLSATMKPILRVWIISAALCLVQKDLGGAIIITCIVLTLLFMAGTPLRIVFPLSLMSIIVGGIFTLSSSSRRNRWTAFMNLDETKSGYGYQVWQSILALPVSISAPPDSLFDGSYT